MPTFHCGTCGVNIADYPDYLSSPCATCRLAADYTTTKRAALFDSCGTDEAAEEQHEQFFAKVDEELEHLGDAPPKTEDDIKELTPENVQILTEAIQKQLMITLAGVMVKLLKLAKSSPIMFEIVVKKMQYPYMSYSELGASLKEPCSKQNVLYHLKHAVELFPELQSVLLTDTRFSGGRYALQTVANRVRQEAGIKRIQGLLYGELDETTAKLSVKELNAILHAPFMVEEDVLNFNPYITDEDY